MAPTAMQDRNVVDKRLIDRHKDELTYRWLTDDQ